MVLPDPSERELIHTRDVVCHGYRRGDGLWDLEGRLEDTKTYAFENRSRGTVDPGEPVHRMYLRLTVDDGFVIREVEADSEAFPYGSCPDIAPDYSRMVGVRIGPGFTRAVRERLGAEKGCIHLSRLLDHLAAVAIQTIGPLVMRERVHTSDADRPPPHLDGCHAMRRDGEVVREHYPKWFEPRGTAEDD